MKRKKPFFDDKTQLDLNCIWVSALVAADEILPSNGYLKLAEEFDYRLIRSNKNDRGFTKINSVLFKNQKLKWKRLNDNSDIIKIELIDDLKPGEKILFSVIYEIKLPNSKVFKYGINKYKDVRF